MKKKLNYLLLLIILLLAIFLFKCCKKNDELSGKIELLSDRITDSPQYTPYLSDAVKALSADEMNQRLEAIRQLAISSDTSVSDDYMEAINLILMGKSAVNEDDVNELYNSLISDPIDEDIRNALAINFKNYSDSINDGVLTLGTSIDLDKLTAVLAFLKANKGDFNEGNYEMYLGNGIYKNSMFGSTTLDQNEAKLKFFRKAVVSMVDRGDLTSVPVTINDTLGIINSNFIGRSTIFCNVNYKNDGLESKVRRANKDYSLIFDIGRPCPPGCP